MIHLMENLVESGVSEYLLSVHLLGFESPLFWWKK